MAVAPFALDPLLAAVRERSTGIGSHIHGELHWRTVGAYGFWLAGSVEGVDTQVPDQAVRAGGRHAADRLERHRSHR